MRILDLPGAPDFSRPMSQGVLVPLGVLAGLVSWVLLAFDGRHLPDEGLYLYMAAYSTVGEILDPQWAPAHPFYVSRILHLLTARAIFVLFGPGEVALRVIAAIHALFVLAAIWLGSATIRRLVPWQPRSVALAGLLFAVSPMPLWLVGKTLPESPALLATSVALYAFVRALACPDPRRAAPWLGLTSLALVAIALTRNVFLLAPLTLGASLLLFGGWRFPPGRVLAYGVTVGAVSGALLIGTLALLGIDLTSYFWVVGFARQEHAPLAVRLYAVFMEGGPLLLALPIVLVHLQRADVGFLLVWFALATGTMFVLLHDLEARYFLANMVPLLGLGGFALETLAKWCRARANHLLHLGAGLLVATFVLVGRLAQPFMEHDLDSTELEMVVRTLDRLYGGPQAYTLLAAWHHSDYHYLRVAHPDRRIHSVERTRNKRSVTDVDPKDHAFYGEAIVLDSDTLARIPRPWLYFGVGANPPITNLRWLADRLPIEELRRTVHGIIDRVAKRRHFFDTWVWRDPRIRVVPVLELGHYRVAELIPAEPTATAERPSDDRVGEKATVEFRAADEASSATMLP